MLSIIFWVVLIKTHSPFFRSHHLSITPQWWALTNHFSFHATMVIGLILSGSCAGNHNCCELRGAVVQSGLAETIAPLYSSLTSGFNNFPNFFPDTSSWSLLLFYPDTGSYSLYPPSLTSTYIELFFML